MTIRILGIESSCDETAAAIVADGREILSSVVASQNDIHRKYGGVVPELASREHLRQIVPVVREALERAGLQLQDVDAVGVTQGPGLVGSLLVGVTYGKVLAMSLGKPLVPVNHLEGHVHAVLLEAQIAGRQPQLPAVCLIVSGGHTLLYEVTARHESGLGIGSREKMEYRRLGGTRDDAAGEAYDKVAKLLALGYPGGPIIDQLADPEQPGGGGNPKAIRFGPAKMKGNPLDFSFSGLKTAVLYHVREHQAEFAPEIETRNQAIAEGRRKAADLRPLCSKQTLDLVASFQKTVVRELVSRTLAAANQCNLKTILVSGGVAANRELRQTFDAEGQRLGLGVFFPSRELSTDNAAMIAAAAFDHYDAGAPADAGLNAMPNLRLGSSA
ncbi:MAG TPA: tRNA (adenosine(37)-N6)-threonylcarbamoyltransferase complex transferase subunit TsaD [Candidatus Acidoferrales bacterium]|jgi:N6-L-threonylcarbamoyladenine synthase|nr:tRNA (adenosine(37)-N6)-threonylcarbamoyltransferase complex transferase subunit TsaD [Candidatus Acidoferrales bacterium]